MSLNFSQRAVTCEFEFRKRTLTKFYSLLILMINSKHFASLTVKGTLRRLSTQQARHHKMSCFKNSNTHLYLKASIKIIDRNINNKAGLGHLKQELLNSFRATSSDTESKKEFFNFLKDKFNNE